MYNFRQLRAIGLVTVLFSSSAYAVTAKDSSPFNFTAIATKHIRVVADPSFEGRMTMRPGNVRAATYIESVFRKAGLKFQDGKNSYLQPYNLTIGQEPTKNNIASGTDFNGKSFSLKLEKDFIPTVGSAEMKSASGQVIWIGTAMPSGELTGKIVAISRKIDPANPQNILITRITKAVEMGASGIMIVGPSVDGRRELPIMGARSGIPKQLNTVCVGITLSAFKAITNLDANQAISSPDSTNVKIRLICESQKRSGQSNDVVGILPGNDPKLKNEYIVVGGHYDHLGYGETGSRSGTSEIHNGADDNASGTAGVLTLVEYFSKMKSNRRTIIFQSYSGEELGLLGSAAWTSQNPVLLPKIQTMINMDMIGRLREENLLIYCVDSANEFKTLLDTISVPGVKPKYIFSSPGNSDHASFIANGVPSLFFHTDLHEEYHTEKDTLATINFDGMGRTIDYMRQTIERIDVANNKFVYAAKSATPSVGGGDPERPRRVRTGFVPDMSDGNGKPGLALNGVGPGSPAEAAGIKAGDRLLEFDGKAVNNIEDLQKVLSEAKANVAVKIKIKRGDQILELMITPTAPL